MTDVPVHQEILFLDDFLHQNSNSVHWDHIKFNHPVYLDQIIIIPDSCPISLKNGSTHYGKTQPNRFRLEFYANNLNKKNEERATLDKIGGIPYEDHGDDLSSFILKPSSIPLDWLVIVGSYSCLSVGVIGVKAKQSSSMNQITTMMPNIPQTQYDPNSYQNILRPPPSLPLGQHILQEHVFQTPPLTISPSQPMMRPNHPPILPPTNTGAPLLPAPNIFVRNKDQIRFSNQMGTGPGFQPNFQQFQQRPIQQNNIPQIRQNFYRSSSMNRINPNANTSIPSGISQNVQQINTNIENIQQNESSGDKQIKTEPNESSLLQTQANSESKLVKDDSSSSLVLQQFPSQQIQPQLIESNLVKHYLDLDENKDEADFISSTESALFSISKGSNQQEQIEKIFDDYLSEQFNPFNYQLNERVKKIKMPILTKYENYQKFNKNSSLNEDLVNLYLESDILKRFFNEINNKKEEVFILNQTEIELLDDLLNELSKIDKSARSFTLFNSLFVNNPTYFSNLIDFLVKILNVDCFLVKIELNDETNNKIVDEEINNDEDGETKVKKLKLEEQSNKKIEIDLEKIKLKEKQTMLKKELKWNSLKIRQIKLVFSYLNLLLSKYDENIASKIIDKNIQNKLIDFYENFNKNELLRNESINLKCLYCLKSSLYFKYGMDKFIETNDTQNAYNRLVSLFIKSKNLNKKLTSRTTHLISTIISKVAFYESLNLFTLKCHKNLIEKSSKENDNEFLDDMIKLLEYIYVYIYRALKLNRNREFSLRDTNLNETDEENDEDSDDSNLDLDDLKQQNGLPLQNLFDSIELKTNNSLNTYHHFLLLFDRLQTFKYILMLWSYIMTNLTSHQNFLRLTHLNNLIEKFLSDFIIINKKINPNYSGIEYLINTPKLTNCMLKIMLSATSNLSSDQIGKPLTQNLNKIEFYSKSMFKLAYCLKALDIFDNLIFNLDKLLEKKPDTDNLVLILLESVDMVQTFTFLLNHDSKTYDSNETVSEILINFLSGPDGNMSNKYMDCLLNWFEYLIEDNLYEKALESQNDFTNEILFNNSRCNMLNSIADIFLTMCRSNKNWSLPNINSKTESNDLNSLNDNNNKNHNFGLCMKRLNKLLSNLLNYLVITKLKPVISINQSYFVLIEKIKSIKSYIEPLVIQLNSTLISQGLSDECKLANSLVIETNNKINYFNNIIDLFRINIDKNLNMFFLKQFCSFNLNINVIKKSNTTRSNETNKMINNLKINYLNSHITQLVLIRNMVEIEENLLEVKLKKFGTSSKLADNETINSLDLLIAQSNLDLNEKFSKRLYLGQLISRSFWKILLNFLSKLNDYVIFYTMQLQNNNKSLLLNLIQLEQLIFLLEPAIYLIKIQIINLIKLREEKFKDSSPLETLFKFYGLFNYTIQSSILNLKQNHFSITNTCSFKKIMFIKANNNLFNTLVNKFDLINKYLIEIFVSFMHKFQVSRSNLKTSLYTSMYRELARYTIETPFNFIYGLNLLSELLPMPLPILVKQKDGLSDRDLYNSIAINERKDLNDHLEPLFHNEKLNSINLAIDSQDANSTTHSTFVYMIRIMSQLSSKTKLSSLFRRVCIQLCNLSDKVCSLVLKTILDYAIELLDRIKFDYDMIDAENEIAKNEPKTPIDKMDSSIDNDDSIYDTKSLYDENLDGSNAIENTSYKNEDEINKVLFELSDSNQGPKENDTSDINESNIIRPSPLEIENETPVKSESYKQNILFDEAEQTDFKISMVLTFTRLIKFLSGLLSIEFKHARFNPIRVQFYHLINDSTGGESLKKKSYSQFIYECVKYCNQLDLVNKKPPNSDTTNLKANNFPNSIQSCLIQESIFYLVEIMIKHVPNLFINNFKIEDFLNDNGKSSDPSGFESVDNRKFTFEMIINLILKTLFDHLNSSKPDSSTVSQHAIKCLILMNKLSAIYFQNNQLIFDSKHSELNEFNFITFPLVKQHLKPAYLNSLVNYINELLNLFKKQNSNAKIIDELTKFYIYIDSLVYNLNLLSKYNEEKSLLIRLKESLKWSITNTNELLIDSITTSSSLSTNNQHSLINLDKIIENLQSSMSKEDTKLNKKYKFCLNQSKSLIKLLNDSDVLRKDSLLLNNNLNEIENGLNIDELVEIPSQQAFETYFFKREVYLCVDNKEELKQYENEWNGNGYLLESTLSVSTLNSCNPEDIEINLESISKSALNTSNLALCLISDKDLVKQLMTSFEHYQQQLQQQNQQSSMSQEDLLNEQLNKGEKLGEQGDQKSGLVKTKSQEVINTRTGTKYKAPMRGGHNNSIGRGLNQTNSSQMNPPNITSGLMNPPATPGINRHDPFRTRPPNTSRPPSVHVDDYYRMESAQAQKQQQFQTQQNTNSSLIQIETTSNNSNLIGVNVIETNTKINEQMPSFNNSNQNFQRQMMLPNNQQPINNFYDNESNKMSGQNVGNDPLVPINIMNMSEKANTNTEHLIIENQINNNGDMFIPSQLMNQQQQSQSVQQQQQQQQQSQLMNMPGMQNIVWQQQQQPPQQQRFPRPQMQRNNSLNQNKNFIQINTKMNDEQLIQQIPQQQFETGNYQNQGDSMNMMQNQQQPPQTPMSPNSAIQMQFQMQQGLNQAMPLLNQNQMFQSPPHQNQISQPNVRFQGPGRGGFRGRGRMPNSNNPNFIRQQFQR